jgi:hypothetical protein
VLKCMPSGFGSGLFRSPTEAKVNGKARCGLHRSIVSYRDQSSLPIICVHAVYPVRGAGTDHSFCLPVTPQPLDARPGQIGGYRVSAIRVVIT